MALSQRLLHTLKQSEVIRLVSQRDHCSWGMTPKAEQVDITMCPITALTRYLEYTERQAPAFLELIPAELQEFVEKTGSKPPALSLASDLVRLKG